MSDVRTVSVIVRGRVQGVSYRAWTKEKRTGSACRAGCATGRTGASRPCSADLRTVERMLGLCRKGPLLARVDDVAVSEGAAPPATPGFTVERG